MTDRVIHLSSSLPASLVGRKAAALGRLVEAGFPVPPAVCITTQAFRAAASSPAGLARLPEGLLDELRQALPPDAPLAVRSSAVQEDLPEASLAGRYATRLNVRGPAALERAIREVWQSYGADPAANGEGGMAVLIQPLVEAECAGVCFTVDPVRLRPDLLLVVSGWGLGAGVVDGSIPTDTARLRRGDLGMEDFSVADKHSAIRPALSGGVATVAVPGNQRTIPCLPESWLQRVGQFGLAIEQVFGAPQDVEWAAMDGQLTILQSRPITALPPEIRQAVRFPVTWENEEQPRHYWWLEYKDKRDQGALLPAEIDLLRLRITGGQEAVDYGGGAYTRWFKFTNGRGYMAVARSGLDPGRVRVHRAAMQDLFERMREHNVTLWEYWGPEIVKATARLAAFDGRTADGTALAEHLENAMATASRHWMVHTLVQRPMRSAELLKIYAQMTGLPPEQAAAEIPFLLAGAETVQTRLVEALFDLAGLALKVPQAVEMTAGRGLGRLLDQPEAEPLRSAFERLMDGYGGRTCYQAVPGYPVELPFTWREAPQHVWEMVAAYLPLARQGEDTSPRQARQAARHQAEQRLEALCAASDPNLAATFRQALDYARRNAAFTDEHNHYIDQVSEGENIQALHDAGRWLATQGQLEQACDVFWLRTDEVLAALRDRSVAPGAVLAERKEAFAEQQALCAPACLGLPEAGLPVRPSLVAGPPIWEEAPATVELNVQTNALTGEPASRGQASGRARVVYDTEALPELAPGDVLVARSAGLIWSPVLPVVAALVLDYGSPGDHAAITAREFGVPMVCSTLHATRLIPEGAWVRVEAERGLVSWDTPEPATPLRDSAA